MRQMMTVTLATAALGAALAASAIPASAQVARAQPAFSAGENSDLLTLVRDRGDRGERADRTERREAREDRADRADRANNSRSASRAWRGNSRWSDARWRHHRRDRDSFGIGFAFAPSFAEPYPYVDDDAVAYCVSRFQSYDIASGSYLGYDGLRHPCP